MFEDYKERLEKERKIENGIKFLTTFAVLLKFRNKENAFVEASKYIGKIGEKVYGGILTVEEALEELAKEYEEISEALSTSFRLFKNEFFSPEQNFDKVFKEAMDLIKRERMRMLDKYESSFRFHYMVISFSPAALFMVFTIFLGMMEVNTTFAFVLSSLIFPFIVYYSLTRIARAEIKMPNLLLIIPTLIFPLIIIPAVKFLKDYLRSVQRLKEYNNEKKILNSLTSIIHETIIKLKRGLPLDVKPIAGKDFLIEIVNKAFSEVSVFGKKGVEILDSIRYYIIEILDYRKAVEARLESFRSNLKFLYFVMPFIILISVWGFKFLAENLQNLQSSWLMLKITPINLPVVFGFINASYVAVANMLSYVVAEKEELAECYLNYAATSIILLLLLELKIL